jgi:superoxide dismutase
LLIFEPKRPQVLVSEINVVFDISKINDLQKKHQYYAELADSLFRRIVRSDDPYWESPMSSISFLSAVKHEKRKKSQADSIFLEFDRMGGTECLSELININTFWQIFSHRPQRPTDALTKLFNNSFGGLRQVRDIVAKNLAKNTWVWFVYKNETKRLSCISSPELWAPYGEPSYIPLLCIHSHVISDFYAAWPELNWSAVNCLFSTTTF